jgi:hypothetical protein
MAEDPVSVIEFWLDRVPWRHRLNLISFRSRNDQTENYKAHQPAESDSVCEE